MRSEDNIVKHMRGHSRRWLPDSYRQVASEAGGRESIQAEMSLRFHLAARGPMRIGRGKRPAATSRYTKLLDIAHCRVTSSIRKSRSVSSCIVDAPSNIRLGGPALSSGW